MAKRKTKRKVGAVKRAKSTGTARLAGLVIGAAATGLLNKMVGEKIDGKILSAGEVAIGYFLPQFIKGNALVAGVGDGMIAAGGLNMLKEFGVLNGMNLINGYSDLNTINGLPQQLEDMAIQPQQTYKKVGGLGMANVINGVPNFDEYRLG